MEKNIIYIILAVLIPPVMSAIEHGISLHLLINILLYIFVPWIGGVIYFFWSIMCPIVWIIISILLPPVTVWFATKDWLYLIAGIVLCLFLWIPGIIFAFWTLYNGNHSGSINPNKNGKRKLGA